MENLSGNVVRTSDVIGKKIIGRNQEHLGKVEELVLDKLNGEIRYAVLARGGFMGIGCEFYAIPWAVLEYCTDHDAFEVKASKEDLEKAPGFNKDSWPDFADQHWDKSNREFYNYIIVKSPMVHEQKDFISEGGNNQPLNSRIQS
jgi:sporulation protein YlmC with PRC-barrel domain